jgi:hypothetical protein
MRKSSTKHMATIPDKYSPDFAERLDRRTVIAKAIVGRIESIETDMGGADSLSHARRSLVRRVVWLEAIIEHSEQQLATGKAIDLGGHTQAINSLLGLYRLIGLERRLRPTETLRDLMYRDDPDPQPAPDRGATVAVESESEAATP